MINKLRSADDHLHVKQKPRPAMNIDVVRRLAAAETAAGVLELIKQVAARFGGLSHLKCLPELAATDPAAAAARYHMLPVMATVVFAPRGLTVGGLLADPAVRAAWADLRAARPSDEVSSEQWQLDHDAAVRLLETKCDPNEPVKMHCEVQVVTAATAGVRHRMHEVYKVVRASSGAQLHADVAKPAEEAVVDDAYVKRLGGGQALRVAAWGGRVATVKRLLLQGSGGSAVGGQWGGWGDGGDGSGGAVDVNWQGKAGTTAVYMAAGRGHLPVVMVLLAHAADPNLARTTDGTTPAYMAAHQGHAECLQLLLEHAADPNLARTADGRTPAHMAVQNGHAECLQLLLEHAADPNTTTTDDGRTPALIAAQNGHVECLQLLLEHAADPNLATTTDGRTPAYMAAEKGREK
eukprot:gene32933-biopygen16613